MPDVMDEFPQLQNMSVVDLHARYSTLKASAPDGNLTKLPDETLRELVCISRVLRTKSSVAAKPSKSAAKAAAPALDAL